MSSFTSIQNLNQRHFKILDYCIAGLTNSQIAEKLGMCQKSISIIVQSGSFQHELAIRRKGFQDDLDEKLASHEADASKILKENSSKAALCLVKGMTHGTNEATKLRSAESILDRTGHGRAAASNDDSNRTIINMKQEDLELLNDTLKLEKQIIEINKPKEVISVVVDKKPEIETVA